MGHCGFETLVCQVARFRAHSFCYQTCSFAQLSFVVAVLRHTLRDAVGRENDLSLRTLVLAEFVLAPPERSQRSRL